MSNKIEIYIEGVRDMSMPSRDVRCSYYIPWERSVLLLSLGSASDFALDTFIQVLTFPVGYNRLYIVLCRDIFYPYYCIIDLKIHNTKVKILT